MQDPYPQAMPKSLGGAPPSPSAGAGANHRVLGSPNAGAAMTQGHLDLDRGKEAPLWTATSQVRGWAAVRFREARDKGRVRPGKLVC